MLRRCHAVFTIPARPGDVRRSAALKALTAMTTLAVIAFVRWCADPLLFGTCYIPHGCLPMDLR